MSGVFCEHKKVRTTCPICRATAVPPPPREATPYVSQDERDARAEKRAARAASEPKRAPGPGKPLLPTRRRTKGGITRDEAEHAEAWWVPPDKK